MLEKNHIMIDTIRFRGDFLTLDLLEPVSKVLDRLVKYNGESGEMYYEFLSGQLTGSYDYRISFVIKDMDWVYSEVLGRPAKQEVPPYFQVELSLHKFLLGHNVYGLDDDLSRIHKVYDFLEESFGFPFIKRETVKLLRIDLAEVYKFDNQEQVNDVFHALKNKKKYRTTPSKYGSTGLYFPGTMTTFKIYDKHAEFKKHDFSRLKKFNSELANHIYDFSQYCVRLECEIHKKKLNELYGLNAYVEDLIMAKIHDLKEIYVREKKRLIFEAKDEVALKTVHDVRQHMLDNMKPLSARNLYAFWSAMVFEGDEYTRREYSKSAYYSNKKKCVDLGIPFYEYGFKQEDNGELSAKQLFWE